MSPTLDQVLGALLDFRLADWHGLPYCLTEDVTRILGTPSEARETHLGAYPARSETYSVPASASGGLVVYSRAQRVVAVETAKPPPVEAMGALEPHDVRKRPEFSLPGYLVYEYLYCRRGLVLSVAEPLDPAGDAALKIARCRGIRPLEGPLEYGAEYYLALQSRMVFD